MQTSPGEVTRAPVAREPGTDHEPPARSDGPAWLWRIVPIGIGLALVAGVVLRFFAQSELWLDEALTVNIASVPLGDLVDTLRRDGSPPLFYVLLHFWIDIFGDGNAAVRSLSGVFGLAALPAMWFTARRLGGRALAWIALLLLALSPFAIRYSNEARPYSLQILLVLLGTLAMRRAFERPSVARLAVIVLLTGLLLYDAYWSLYLVVVVGAYLVFRSVRDPDPRAARRVLVAVAIGCATFLPWVPVFLDQLAHTGTPWATPVSLTTAVGHALIDFGGGFVPAGWLMGPLLVAFAALGLFGVALDRRYIRLDLLTRPLARNEAAIGIGTLVVGGGIAWVTAGAFEPRYASVVLPLYLLVAAAGFLTLASRTLRSAVFAVVLLLGFAGGIEQGVTNRTQAGEVTSAINEAAQPGDVVGFCPDQVGPDVDRLLSVDVQALAWPDGASPEFVDWTDYEERNAATDPAAYAQVLLDVAGPGTTIWLVWAPGYRTLETSCEAVVTTLQGERPDAETVVVGDDSFFEFQNLTRFGPP